MNLSLLSMDCSMVFGRVFEEIPQQNSTVGLTLTLIKAEKKFYIKAFFCRYSKNFLVSVLTGSASMDDINYLKIIEILKNLCLSLKFFPVIFEVNFTFFRDAQRDSHRVGAFIGLHNGCECSVWTPTITFLLCELWFFFPNFHSDWNQDAANQQVAALGRELSDDCGVSYPENYSIIAWQYKKTLETKRMYSNMGKKPSTSLRAIDSSIGI